MVERREEKERWGHCPHEACRLMGVINKIENNNTYKFKNVISAKIKSYVIQWKHIKGGFDLIREIRGLP